jgi:hypothetical protein
VPPGPNLARRVGRAAQDTWRTAASRWILAAAFLICLAGWTLDLRPLAPVWGDVATDARRQRAREEERRINEEIERREAMARSVSIAGTLSKTQHGPGPSITRS